MRFVILNHDADRFRQEIYLRGLNFEVEDLKRSDTVKSAQLVTATLYKDWQDIKVAEVTPRSRLSNFLSSANTQTEKFLIQESTKRANEEAALFMYFNQGERRNSDY